MTPFTPPALNKTAFHCPHCSAYANQEWYAVMGFNPNIGQPELKGWRAGMCKHCGKITVWLGNSLMYPDASSAPPPNTDLPAEIIADYNEARNIISRSPRGAAAIFRLCIQKLCKHLGEPGANINADIAALVKKGLNPKIQKSLDIVRVIGNEAVHPGQIDITDKPETAVNIASLINVIADAMITQPKAIEQLYQTLPEDKRQQIDKRDGR